MVPCDDNMIGGATLLQLQHYAEEAPDVKTSGLPKANGIDHQANNEAISFA
jgi:hypothetical protein